MQTAEEIVQEFLFKNKPKRKYHNEFDVKDLVSLLQKFANEYHKSEVKNLGLFDVMQRSEQLISLLKKLKEENMCSVVGDELIDELLKEINCA